MLRWPSRAGCRAWILPDDLTALGVVASIGICAAYALSSERPLAVGRERPARRALARRLARRHARPRARDRAAPLRLLPRPPRRRLRHRGDRDRPRPLAATCCSSIGAPRRRLPRSSRSTSTSRARRSGFSIGYGKLGPTEARILLIALNTALALGPDLARVGRRPRVRVLDVVGIGLAAGMLGALVVRAARQPARAGEARAGGLAPRSPDCLTKRLRGPTMEARTFRRETR